MDLINWKFSLTYFPSEHVMARIIVAPPVMKIHLIVPDVWFFWGVVFLL